MTAAAVESQHLYNGDFEIPGKTSTGSAGWHLYKSSSRCYARVDNENSFSGKSSLLITKDDYDSNLIIEQDINHLFKVTPGNEYILTFPTENG